MSARVGGDVGPPLGGDVGTLDGSMGTLDGGGGGQRRER